MKNSNRALKVLQSVQTLDGKESKSLQIDVVWGKKYEYIEHVLKKKKDRNKIVKLDRKQFIQKYTNKNTAYVLNVCLCTFGFKPTLKNL